MGKNNLTAINFLNEQIFNKGSEPSFELFYLRFLHILNANYSWTTISSINSLEN